MGEPPARSPNPCLAIVSTFVVRGPLNTIVPTRIHWRLGGSLALPLFGPEKLVRISLARLRSFRRMSCRAN
jgi:hypothetical protein